MSFVKFYLQITQNHILVPIYFYYLWVGVGNDWPSQLSEKIWPSWEVTLLRSWLVTFGIVDPTGSGNIQRVKHTLVFKSTEWVFPWAKLCYLKSGGGNAWPSQFREKVSWILLLILWMSLSASLGRVEPMGSWRNYFLFKRNSILECWMGKMSCESDINILFFDFLISLSSGIIVPV